MFNGWNTKKDGSGTKYSNKQSVKNLTSNNGATITLYAQWKAHVCTITFDSNGGIFNSNSTNTKKTIDYGKSSGNMRDANGGFYNATHSSTFYHIVDGKEWKNGNTTYDQNQSYSATTLCPNLSKKDQQITLKVNWDNNWYLCRDGKTCLNAIPDWKDCTNDISKTTSDGQIRSFQITGESEKYFTINYYGVTKYIWKGCLRNNETAAQTDCPNSCLG